MRKIEEGEGCSYTYPVAHPAYFSYRFTVMGLVIIIVLYSRAQSGSDLASATSER